MKTDGLFQNEGEDRMFLGRYAMTFGYRLVAVVALIATGAGAYLAWSNPSESDIASVEDALTVNKLLDHWDENQTGIPNALPTPPDSRSITPQKSSGEIQFVSHEIEVVSDSQEHLNSPISANSDAKDAEHSVVWLTGHIESDSDAPQKKADSDMTPEVRQSVTIVEINPAKGSEQ